MTEKKQDMILIDFYCKNQQRLGKSFDELKSAEPANNAGITKKKMKTKKKSTESLHTRTQTINRTVCTFRTLTSFCRKGRANILLLVCMVSPLAACFEAW